MSDDIQELLEHGHRIADIMGKQAIEESHKSIAIRTKIDRTNATNVDDACENMARGYVKEFRPNDNFLGEEGGRTIDRPKANDISWICDPVDGTKALIKWLEELAKKLSDMDKAAVDRQIGLMQQITQRAADVDKSTLNIMTPSIWTNLIAAFRGENLLFGIINNPTTGERLWGGPDLPARYSSIDKDTGKRVETSIVCADATSLNQLSWASTTRNYMDVADRKAFEALEKIAKPHEGGDAMLYAWLALKKFTAVYDGDMAPWDIAAPAGVVMGAKGVVTDGFGNPIDFFREGKTTVVAAATRPLHQAVLSIQNEARRPAFDLDVAPRNLKS